MSPGIDSARLCSLAGWYDNPIPTQFLALIDCSKTPALVYVKAGRRNEKESLVQSFPAPSDPHESAPKRGRTRERREKLLKDMVLLGPALRM
jgi:hypothetical protein